MNLLPGPWALRSLQYLQFILVVACLAAPRVGLSAQADTSGAPNALQLLLQSAAMTAVDVAPDPQRIATSATRSRQFALYQAEPVPP